MIYKFLFYFISWFNKKVDLLGGTDEYCYYAASALVGWTMAVGLYAIINVVCIVFIQSNSVYRVISNIMDILCIITSLLSFLYFRHNGRWNNIYKEIQHSSISQKYRYGFYCLLYVLFSYGLWFLSDDMIKVLNTGNGLSFAIRIVDSLNLAYW
jgi:hypothetical protein